ncbi:MAG: hypothetical protein HYW16_03285 [Candidatus Rokubacteria bacterium]|nr:hypothetical protein [Candidatus Rokubacteria bacterium]MBI2544233.1 hypothetical protein [Candidatus Rokubacteria bacterium]
MDPSRPGRSGQVLRVVALLAALTVAYFAGVLTERFRFDAQRNAVIEKYNKALKDYHDQQMKAEKASEKTTR